jgi:hypothetical protein
VAKFIASDYFVSINGVDLSSWAKAVEMSLEKDRVDVSGFNSTGAKEFLPGQKEEVVTVTFNQDHAANAVDATLWPLYNNGTTFPVIFRPTSSAASATNPAYSGSANLYTYDPMNAELGEVSEIEAEFTFTGSVSRGTA